jgi:hypothetical protein
VPKVVFTKIQSVQNVEETPNEFKRTRLVISMLGEHTELWRGGVGETGWKVVTGRKSYYYARLARFQNNIFFAYLPVPPTMSLPFFNSLSAA